MDKDNMHIDPEELVIGYYTNKLTAQEQERLLSLLQSDPAVEQMFREYSAMQSSLPAKEIDYTSAYGEFLSKIEDEKPKGKTISLYRISAAVAAVAATVLVALYMVIPGKTEFTTVLASTEIKEVKLPDNSVVNINAGTDMAYSSEFAGDRSILLNKGEAYFEVATDSLHPFVVETPDAVIRVLGTGFNVKIDSLKHTTAVTVLHGKVSVAGKENNKAKILIMNQKATLVQGADEFSEPAVANINELAWQTNKLVFKSCPMPEVVETLNSFFGCKLEIQGSDLDSCRVNATINEPDLQEILGMLKLAFDVELIKKNNKQILKGPGC